MKSSGNQSDSDEEVQNNTCFTRVAFLRVTEEGPEIQRAQVFVCSCQVLSAQILLRGQGPRNDTFSP